MKPDHIRKIADIIEALPDEPDYTSVSADDYKDGLIIDILAEGAHFESSLPHYATVTNVEKSPVYEDADLWMTIEIFMEAD